MPLSKEQLQRADEYFKNQSSSGSGPKIKTVDDYFRSRNQQLDEGGNVSPVSRDFISSIKDKYKKGALLSDTADAVDKVMKPASDFVVGGIKSFAESGARQITDHTSPISPLKNIDPTGQITKPFLNKVPEKVSLPLYGETSIKYSEDPLTKFGQQSLDAISAYAPEGGKVVAGAAKQALDKKALARGAEEVASTVAPKVKGTVKKVMDDILDLTMPNLSKTEKATAISKERGIKSGLFRGSKLAPETRDLERAEVIKDFVDPKIDIFDNIKTVRTEIGNKADEVINHLKENNAIFNKRQLTSKLKEIEKPLSLSGDTKLNTMYDMAQQKFMRFVDEQPKNLEGLLEARKRFDQWIGDQVPKVWEDQASKPLHDALRRMRTAANDFIAEKLPEGVPFKDLLHQQNLMYEAVDNMSEKAAGNLGKGKIYQRIKDLEKKYPLETKIGKALGAGTIGATVYDVVGN